LANDDVHHKPTRKHEGAMIIYVGKQSVLYFFLLTNTNLDQKLSICNPVGMRISPFVSPYDISPTLSAYLGVNPPSGSSGVPLLEVLKE